MAKWRMIKFVQNCWFFFSQNHPLVSMVGRSGYIIGPKLWCWQDSSTWWHLAIYQPPREDKYKYTLHKDRYTDKAKGKVQSCDVGKTVHVAASSIMVPPLQSRDLCTNGNLSKQQFNIFDMKQLCSKEYFCFRSLLGTLKGILFGKQLISLADQKTIYLKEAKSLLKGPKYEEFCKTQCPASISWVALSSLFGWLPRRMITSTFFMNTLYLISLWGSNARWLLPS